MDLPISEIEKKLGYVFKDKTLLEEAFTHSSYANRYGVPSNERMEYLGDSVLQLVVTEWQYRKDKQATEGLLTKIRQKLVCKDALESAVDGLEIYPYLLYSGKVENVGDKSKSSLFEAVVAAIYLDGGYKAATKFILAHGNLRLDKGEENPKGELKEFLEKRGEKEPLYESQKSGKDNAPIFKCRASALGKEAFGSGKSKKEAEQTAAARLLWEIRQKYGKETKQKK